MWSIGLSPGFNAREGLVTFPTLEALRSSMRSDDGLRVSMPVRAW